MNIQLSENSILDEISATIEDYQGSTFDEWFEETFNGPDPYIIGTALANENLMNYHGQQFDGPLAALSDAITYLKMKDLIKDEKDFIDHHYITNPEDLASIIAYCLGDYYFNEILSNTELELDDEINDENIKTIKTAVETVRDDPETEFTKYIY